MSQKKTYVAMMVEVDGEARFTLLASDVVDACKGQISPDVVGGMDPRIVGTVELEAFGGAHGKRWKLPDALGEVKP